MNSFLENISKSLDNLPDGWSGKKITIAIVTVSCFVFPIDAWTIWAYLHNDFSLLTAILVIVSSLITALFATNVVDKYKNKPNDNNTTE